MSTLVWVYLGYVALCGGITIWVGSMLRRNGPTFIAHGSDLPETLVASMTHLLIVGFYLVNFGVIAFALKSSTAVRSAESAIELLSTKVGAILLVLGGMHFMMLAAFARLRHTDALRSTRPTPPPVRI